MTREAEIEGNELLEGRQTTIINASLDTEALFAESLGRELDDESRQALRDGLGDVKLRFWIDDDSRVLQMELAVPGGEASMLRFDFATPVSLAKSVESMPFEEAQRLGQAAEVGGVALLKAIGRYKEMNGSYPSRLDAATLGDTLVGGWPVNPFSGQPVAVAPMSPGDVTYLLKNDGNDIEFQLYGWSGGQLYYDSERFGPISLP